MSLFILSIILLVSLLSFTEFSVFLHPFSFKCHVCAMFITMDTKEASMLIAFLLNSVRMVWWGRDDFSFVLISESPYQKLDFLIWNNVFAKFENIPENKFNTAVSKEMEPRHEEIKLLQIVFALHLFLKGCLLNTEPCITEKTIKQNSMKLSITPATNKSIHHQSK